MEDRHLDTTGGLATKLHAILDRGLRRDFFDLTREFKDSLTGRKRTVELAPVLHFELSVVDTGFVCCSRGWKDVRNEDGGDLWEHLTLDALRTIGPAPRIRYWRDKHGKLARKSPSRSTSRPPEPCTCSLSRLST